uniref:KIB1-4 beta-propeller domain-containing protein n=1 Tax=Brassica oleracea var. oleracea TaxID=109376 RepID=A0A0D3DJ06_BRAOL
MTQYVQSNCGMADGKEEPTIMFEDEAFMPKIFITHGLQKIGKVQETFINVQIRKSNFIEQCHSFSSVSPNSLTGTRMFLGTQLSLSLVIASRIKSRAQKSVRLFSTSPCLSLCCVWDDALGLVEGGSYIGKVLFFDPAKNEILQVPDKTIPQELLNSKPIGASQGWGFSSEQSNHNSLHITDLFNPLAASKSNTKMIPLPPLSSMLYGQTKVVWNVAMSSSSPHEEDCVVAIKFFGRQLSMCKPGRDLAWTNRLIPFDRAENSNLMYSKRDQRFYLPAPGGNYLCSWDLHFDNDPQFNELVFPNFPNLPQSTWEDLDSCIREDHWVESPSGQSFLVKRYSRVGSKAPMVMVLVFREEEDQVTAKGTRNMCYTQDIGDLCIFLSKNDPFCVVASSCPGLKPNSIYMMDHCVSICELANGTVTCFELPKMMPFSPFWIPSCSV